MSAATDRALVYSFWSTFQDRYVHYHPHCAEGYIWEPPDAVGLFLNGDILLCERCDGMICDEVAR